jgi:hypothetical protein
MTMHSTTDKTDTKTPPTPSRGESAVRHLYKRAVEEDRKEDAKLIASVANLLKPDIKLADGLPFEKPAETKKKVDSAQIDGAEVDLTTLEDRDAEDYLAYTREMDGTARRERHVEQMERDDAEDRALFGVRDGS